MKVTVKDCLELPSFQKAEVLAGENSLINRVEKVSVLDMFVPKDIRKHYTAPNQMVLTSFSAIRSDEDAQCKAIEALAAGGSVAIVVFHVGDIVRYLTEKVIAAAEKSGIPLIAMAAGNSADMGDVIGEIYRRIFYGEDENFSNSLITNTIFHLLNFEKYSNFQAAAKAAALNNDFQLILLSEEFNPVFSVETRHRTTIAEAIRLGKQRSLKNRSSIYTKIDVNGVLTYWGPVNIRKIKYFMFIVDNEDSYSAAEITKLAEIIELAMGMWKYTPERDAVAEFINALRRGNMSLAYSLRDEVELEPSEFISVFYAKGGKEGRSTRIMDDFQKDLGIEIFRISEGNEIYGIIVGNHEEEEKDGKKLANRLFSKLKEDKTIRIFHVTGINGIEGAGDGYRLIGEAWSFVQTVFPYKRVFTKYELALVSNCINIQLQGDYVKKNYMEFLEPFRDEGDSKGRQLLETLETFVLDAGMNSADTANFMGIHTNTVQYRLKKINDILGVEITGNRVIPGLTIALALGRLESKVS